MAERRVAGTTKDEAGDIVEICGEWGTLGKADAIREIETGARDFYVEEAGVRTTVEVVEDEDGKHLRAMDDPGSENNLVNLPDC